jgi:hypothetical protein
MKERKWKRLGHWLRVYNANGDPCYINLRLVERVTFWGKDGVVVLMVGDQMVSIKINSEDFPTQEEWEEIIAQL